MHLTFGDDLERKCGHILNEVLSHLYDGRHARLVGNVSTTIVFELKLGFYQLMDHFSMLMDQKKFRQFELLEHAKYSMES
jgi:hypothetical protein